MQQGEMCCGAVLLFQVNEGFPTIAASKKSAMANLSVDAHSRTHCFVLPHLTSDQSFIRLKLSPDARPHPEFQLVETCEQRHAIRALEAVLASSTTNFLS